MKRIFVAIMALGALVSCSKDELVSVNRQAIQFGNAFVENSTRATDPSYSANDIASFQVYGTVNGNNIFEGVTIEKTTADYGDAWTQEDDTNVQYWIPGANYKFVGIVDGNKTGVTSTSTDAAGMPTTISYTADGATDLLCETVVRNSNVDYSVVPFTFTHLLSKVNFTVNNNSTAADGYSFVVKNITFAGNTKGVYDVANKTWGSFTTGNTVIGNERTVNVSGADTKVKDIVVASKAASTELAKEVLFLPGTYTISFTVDILYKGEVITSTSYPTTGAYSYTLAANNAYNFNVSVSVGNKIVFTVSEQPSWTTTGNDKTITLQ